MGRANAAAARGARSVEMVWRDPVTDERLSIAILATPELIRRLESEGFEVEAKIKGRVEAQIEGQITRSAG